ncbi:rna-directed dna polymerase from mobile element jockey [Brachionus plicatilis]|uniref:Rna-directed dna polymerase from mobile element jockey n=1 Tax=Brachionus plicatilis TaxID=10195 RepID=A0A3M7PL24_BRAPC|nr:rna-directed dna polymerase from mobile element jockey [Brachionus plicatilis]
MHQMNMKKNNQMKNLKLGIKGKDLRREKKSILFDGQHGFRSDHSCETALHILISEMNRIKSKKLFGLFLFMDLRKFDLVDPSLLLIKLKKYDFSEKSILQIANYFSERIQLNLNFSNHSSFHISTTVRHYLDIFQNRRYRSLPTATTYGLANFRHRVIGRTTAFSFKVLNDPNAPAALAKSLINNNYLEKKYPFKNIGQLQIPRISHLNNYGMNTFETNNNINLIFDKFVELFPEFDLSYYCFYYK